MDNPAILFVLALVFATFMLGLQGAYTWFQGRQDEEELALRRRLGVPIEGEEDEEGNIVRDDVADGVTEALGSMGDDLRVLLKAAGSDQTVAELVTRMAVIGLALSVGGLVLLGARGFTLGLLGPFVPYLLLRRQADARASSLLDQMPDALELMSRAMQAGTGLPETFRLVATEMPEPIASEFGQVYEEVRFGKTWRDSMTQLIDRYPTLFDLRLFASTLLLQKETGGNLIETLAKIGKTVRERSLFDAKVRAMTSEARASGYVLAGMPVGVLAMVWVVNAPYLEPLVNTTAGHIVDTICVVAYGIGIFMMGAVARVEA